MKLGRYRRLIFLAAFLAVQYLFPAHLGASFSVIAQQLSIRHFDVSDGLAHSHVTALHQDSKGYLWLATWEGLSRYDGYGFTNFGMSDGLGDPLINAVAEDNDGHIWAAANGGGVSRLEDDPRVSYRADDEPGRKKFILYKISNDPGTDKVNAIAFDSQDRIWCGTDSGLYRGELDQNGDLRFEVIVPGPKAVNTAFADSQHRLWFGTENDLIEIVGDQIFRYGDDDEVGRHKIMSAVEDGNGGLLVANERDVFEFVPGDNLTDRGHWKKLPITLQVNQGILTMLAGHDGTLWVGTWNGLIKYRDGRQNLYTSTQGLIDNSVTSLLNDRDGNLWVGTLGGGVSKLSADLIISFTKIEGLPNQNVNKVFEDLAGNIYASVQNGGLVKVADDKVIPIPGTSSPPFDTINERIIQDRRGDWWIGTDVALFRVKGPELDISRARKVIYSAGQRETPIDGGLLEDASSRIWISPSTQGLYIFDPTRAGDAAFDHIPADAILPFTGVIRMVSDSSGEMWLGAHQVLGRLRDGHLQLLNISAGLPETDPRSFFVDSRGLLWVGLRYQGVSVSRDPTVDTPQFFNYSTANGLASNTIWAIAEDDLGRMYFGTGKGLDQLDLATGRIRHFNTGDGLASDIINYCFNDHRGNMWVGTSLGLSKLDSRAEQGEASEAPPVYLSHVQIAGEDVELPVDGTGSLPDAELSASRNNMLIEFVALSFLGERKLRYQYKLDGLDADWSPPTDSRSVNFAHLSPGSYSFLVRAIGENGTVSSVPASFRFQIVPPVWQRPWFIALALAAAALTVYLLYRYRVSHLLRLERIRTRIAADLHDDIGANLSLIAMLSEVARRQLRPHDTQLKEWFETIATTSRDTVDSMSDIVWAVDPNRDQLGDLTRRMRRFAEDASAARNVSLQFNAADVDQHLKLDADQRREIFLIFKEMINNAMRHSGCSSVNVDLTINKKRLVLSVTDDGRGLNGSATADGTGLGSMRGRALRLGGTFEIESAAGSGTTVTLDVPVDHAART